MSSDSEESTHLQDLIATLRRRQRVLESQRARFGEGTVPPQIVLELEDIARDLTRHQAELRRLRPSPIDNRNPYLGLLTFQEIDADRFFGRDTLVADLTERAGKTTFLAVLGASGSGKSSVVRAGLVPMLKGGALPGSEHWHYITLRPGPRPLDVLAAELARLQGDPTLATHYRAALDDSDRALLLIVEAMLDRAADQQMVLVVDQAEELWTNAPAQECGRFISLVLSAAQAPNSSVLMILTMRADFLHRAAEHPELAKAIAEHDVIVSPMTADELRDAIERPAELAAGNFESGLTDELIEQTLGRAGALPLLEYTLQELWKRRESDGTLTWTAYHTIGGIEGALAAHADAILAERYTPEEQEQLRRLLLRLVQPGEGVTDTRRRVPLDDLVPVATSVNAIQVLLKPLTDERLLTTGRDSASNKETIEVSHEALIRAWPTFGRWLEAGRADLRFQLQLEAAASEWQSNNQNIDLLWGGLRLAQAEAWIERVQPQVNALTQAFLDASRVQAAATRRRIQQQAQRLRRLALGLAGALVVALLALIIAGLFASRATHSATEATRQLNLAQTAEAHSRIQLQVAQSQSLAYAAESLRTTNPETALLLASEALQHMDNFVTVQTMRNALDASPWQPTLLQGHREYLTGAVFSPDGQRILTASADETARVWDLSGKQLAILQGHTSAIYTAVFSPDSQRILTASADETARVWDLSGKQLAILQGHMSTVYTAVFSPDSQHILTASRDGTARVWDLNGKVLTTLQGHVSAVYSAVFSPDGQHILTASRDGTARVWDLNGKVLTTLQGHASAIYTAVFSPDGQHILTTSDNTTVEMQDLSGKQLATLQGHTSVVTSATFSPDGQHILTASADQTARVWDLSGKQLATLQGHTSTVSRAVFSPDGQRILTTSDDATARVWDLDGKQLATLQGHTSTIYTALFSPDGQHILTASRDRTARVWVFSGTPLAILQGHTAGISRAVFSSDGQHILTASADRTARVWDLSGKQLATLRGHTAAVTSAVFSSDGQRILTASEDATARVWDLSGKQLAILQGHTSTVYTALFSPDGQRILTASADQTARIWDLSGNPLATLQGHTDNVLNAVFSQDGQHILTTSADQTARMWGLSGKELATFQGHVNGVLGVVFSPDGQHILTASADRTARVWDLSGKQLATLRGHTAAVTSAVFSSDGQRILTASEDATARVWDLSGKQLAILQGHTSTVYTALFSPDGQRILTASADQTARIWDLSGNPLATLQGHRAGIMSAVFSPDSRRILTASTDGTARQYLVRTKDLLAVAACRVGRGLTDEEIQRFQVPTPLLFNFSKRQCPPPIGK